MRPEELKQWRGRLGLTQEAAAKIFNVSRVTEQNWEGARTPIPSWVDYLSRDAERRARQNDPGVGPVYVIYHSRRTDVPIVGRLPEYSVQPEFFRTIEEALRFVEKKWNGDNFHYPAIVDERNEVIWQVGEVAEEMAKRRSEMRDKRSPEEAAAMRRDMDEFVRRFREEHAGETFLTDDEMYDEFGLPK